jgi:hypothetical protein
VTGLGDFARRIRARGAQVETGANKLKRKVALIVDRELVLETPVDTGRARSNWVVSLTAPILDEREPYAPGERLGKSERANAQAAIDQGGAIIATVKPGTDIYISNNVHYIGLLNDGHSAQAPSGYIQSAVIRGANAVKGAKVLL